MFSSRHDVVSNRLSRWGRGCGGLFVGLAAALLTCGCASSDLPETGEVTGVVTLDGKPVPKATITFAPEEGRTSIGETDEKGEYVLGYTPKVPGAKVGRHTIRISTFRAGTGDPGDSNRVAEVPEIIPEKYNKKTTLSEEVEAGKNTLDFKLESK